MKGLKPIVLWALAGIVSISGFAADGEAKREMRLDVKGLCCSTCAVAATGALRQIEGVEHIAFDFSKRTGAVRYDEDVSEKTLFKAVTLAGLQIIPDEQQARKDAPVRVAGLCRLCQTLLADPENAGKVIAAFGKEFEKGRATVSFDATIIRALSSAEAFFASLDQEGLKAFQCQTAAQVCPADKDCADGQKRPGREITSRARDGCR